MKSFVFVVRVCLLPVRACLVVSLLSVACGGSAVAQNVAQDFRTAAGCGPAETQFSAKMGTERGKVAAPSPGKALVYVVEVQSGDATGVTTRVGLNGNWVGGSSGEAYLAFEVDPGEHHLCVDWQSSIESRQKHGGAAVLRAEQGKAYYFVTTVILGNGEDLLFGQVDDAEGLWLLSKSMQSVWKQSK